jgi:hypothetical protein
LKPEEALMPSSDDPVIGRILSTLLLDSHLMAPGALAGHVAAAARPLGVTAARIYLADLQQHQLRPMSDDSGRASAPLAIESTPAGRAFQTITMEHGEDDDRPLWIPLVEGVERLGVLELCFADANEKVGDATVERCRILASLVGLLIASKGTYSDTYTELQRSRTMALQAEMVWAFMAPRAFATGQVLFAAALEPAYEVGGDAFDHSLLEDRFHVSLFDSVGHDLTSGLISSVAMASCRTTRRSGGDLTDIADRADRAIAAEFGASRFATALLCDLNVSTGEFSWLPCGHPPPLLIRDNEKVEELIRRPRLPLGLGEIDAGDEHRQPPVPAYTERLRAGDRLLLYTDGVVEGRDEDGRPFNLARLTDFILRHTAEGLAAPELLRRLTREILDHQRGHLTDDATLILLEWMPERHGQQLTL